MFEVKQSTALDILFFAHDINGDAVTGIADGGFTKNFSKNAAAFGAMTVTITERAGGWYLLPLTAAHTDTLGVMTIYLTSSAKQVNLQFRVAARITDDLATPTNITAGTITTATNVTTVNGLAAGVITATSIAADAITDAKVAADVTIASVTGAVGSVTGNVGGNVVGTVGTVNALAANVITAASINAGAITSAKFAAGAIDAAAIATGAIDADAVAADAATEIANAVWDTDATGRQTQGSFGQALGDPGADTNTIYKAVVTDATGATVGVDVVAIKAETASIQSDTDDLQTQVGTAGAGLTNINLPDQTMNITGNITGNLSGSVGSVTSAVEISAAAVDLVWDEPTAGHATAGTTGKALTDAGSAGDPWTTALPGAYAAGTAGKIIGDNINAPIGTVDTVVDAIKAKTDSLAFTVAGQVDANIQSINDVTITGDGSGTPFNV